MAGHPYAVRPGVEGEMDRDLGRRLLEGMIRIRRTEETLAELYPAQEMRTPTHFAGPY
jgi:hypothetical protein